MERVPETTRQSFDSAYSNLESTVRNFSRDKLQYEERFRKLHADLELRDKKIKENNDSIQTLIDENRKMSEIHESDETARFAAEATLATVSLKQDLIIRAVNDFEILEREVLERYEVAEDFIETVKSRQVQLFNKFHEVRQELQEERQQAMESDLRFKETSANYDMMLEEERKKMAAEKLISERLASELESKVSDLILQNEKNLNEAAANHEIMLEEKKKMAAEKLIFEELASELESKVSDLILQNEKNLSEAAANHEMILEEERKKMAAEKLLSERLLASELESKISDLMLQNEKNLSEAAANHEMILEDERKKMADEKLLSERLLASESESKISDLILQNEKNLSEAAANHEMMLEEEKKKMAAEKLISERLASELESKVSDLMLQNEKNLYEAAANHEMTLEEEKKKMAAEKLISERLASDLESKVSEVKQYAVELHEQLEIVENLRNEKNSLDIELDKLVEEKEESETRFAEELAMKAQELEKKNEIIAFSSKQLESCQAALKVSEDKHQRKIDGLKLFLDNEKVVSSQPRRQSFQLPSSMRSPGPGEKASNRGILKRVNSSERNLKSVSFNKSVDVLKFKPTFTISSSSDSEDSEINETTNDTEVIVPPTKKAKPSLVEEDCQKDNSRGDQHDYSERQNIAPSPKKFFRNRIDTPSPKKTKTYSCKGSRLSKNPLNSSK